MRALKEFKTKLIEYGVSIFVRRGGPNYQEGLRVMRELGKAKYRFGNYLEKKNMFGFEQRKMTGVGLEPMTVGLTNQCSTLCWHSLH